MSWFQEQRQRSPPPSLSEPNRRQAAPPRAVSEEDPLHLALPSSAVHYVAEEEGLRHLEGVLRERLAMGVGALGLAGGLVLLLAWLGLEGLGPESTLLFARLRCISFV